MTDDPQPTEVTDVADASGPIVVYLGRSKHRIETGDELTFLGDSNPGLFETGERYALVGPTSDEPSDAVHFENTESDDRVKAYREDVRYYLQCNCFHIHDA